ncbi:MAG: transcription initiation protein [Actinotalea sp.]|nr:transcription initiation protein [Actinotalea sp.]
MTAYLISFPSDAMDVPAADMPAVGDAARAVVREAKEAGVLVFAGGLDEGVEPVVVGTDGTVTPGTYPQTRDFSGGFTVVDVPSREEALQWAAKIAVACRCGQELRAFALDPME